MSTETSYRVTCDSGSPKCHGRETFSSRKGLVRYIERSRWLTIEDDGGGHICPGCQEWHRGKEQREQDSDLRPKKPPKPPPEQQDRA